MKLAFSTNAFIKKSLTFAIKSIAKSGYEGIEIVVDSPHAFLPLKQSRLDTIKKNLKDYNLKVTNLNANTVAGWHKKIPHTGYFEPSLSNNDEKLRNWRIRYTKNAIDTACELEAPSISITSGVIKNTNVEKNIHSFQHSLEELADYAEQKDVLIGIEYEPGLLVGSSTDLLSIVPRGYNNIGLNFDVCHAAVLNENISSVIKKFKKKLFHTHISDCKNRIHYHLIPGLGDINFKSMYKALQMINYKGFLTAELYTYSDQPQQAAKSTYKYLNNLVR